MSSIVASLSLLAASVPPRATTNDPDWPAIVAAIAGSLAALAAFLGLVYAIRQARQALEEERTRMRQEMAYRYFERYTAPEMLPFLEKWAEYISPSDPGERARRVSQWDRLPFSERGKLLVVPNFFEELGSMYNRGLVDTGVVAEFFGPLASEFWSLAQWWIAPQREKDPELYIQWMQMRRDVQGGREPGHEPTPAPSPDSAPP